MGLEFQLNATPAEVTSVNNRGELHGDEERVVGQDVDLRLRVSVDFLERLVIDADDPPDWKGFLFSEEGLPRALGIKPMQSTTTFEDHVVTLSYVNNGTREKKKFVDVKVKKIKFEPVTKFALALSLQLQLHPQDTATMGWLVQMLVAGECSLKVEPPKQTDAFSKASGGAGEEKDAAE